MTSTHSSPHPQRLVGLMLVALSLAYLWVFVPRGWIPHDEGMIGQSAERVIAGGMPHVDYEEPYTGGLTWMHAAVFKLAGVNLLYARFLLFAAAALAQFLIYLILRRYLEPIGAALGAWVALGWSFPNYFAALPSWWVLLCALACLWAFVKHVETGSLGYLAAAGLAAGLSILIKQTGLYVLVALVMALLYGQSRRVISASVAVVALLLALAILRLRLAPAELLFLLLPIAACSTLLFVKSEDGQPLSLRDTLLGPTVALGAAALPLLVFIAPYLMHQEMGKLINGLFILPQKRVQFASYPMPPAYWILAGLPLVAMVVPLFKPNSEDPLRPGDPAMLVVWFAALALPVAALYNALSYHLIWQAARGFTALLPVAICWLLFSRHEVDPKKRWIMFALASMLGWASLVQFPFSAPIYFCYVTPLAVIAAAAAADSRGGAGRPMVGAVAVLLLAFAVLVMNRGYIYNLGFDHEAYALNVPLNIPKAGLEVGAGEAATYRRVVELVTEHRGGGGLVAGPDCPEVYFLTGQFSPAGTLFDFFDEGISARGLTDISGWANANVVVLNHRPSFSGGISPDLITRVRTLLPNFAVAGPFEVRWR